MYKKTMEVYFNGKIKQIIKLRGTPEHNSENLYREKGSMWYKICGEEFIEVAFRYAHKIDPTSQILHELQIHCLFVNQDTQNRAY